jgi:nucleoside-diphosphate-sugar epimerase
MNRTINLPGLAVTVGEMIEMLGRVAGQEVVARIRFEQDELVERIVTSWPGRFDTSRAATLGFKRDADFESVIRNYQREAFPDREQAHPERVRRGGDSQFRSVKG